MLKNILIERIKKKGKIPFDEFMEVALYHPQYGYYMIKREIGKKGDFFTSPSVSSLFSLTIAKFIERNNEKFLQDEKIQILEIGGGKGYLMNGLIEYFDENNPTLSKKIEFLFLELKPLLFNKRIKYIKESDLKEKSINGWIISNEFFDALPFKRILKKDGKIYEIFIGEKNGKLFEIIDNPTSEATEFIKNFHLDSKKFEETEINIQAYNWIKILGRALNKGYMLTIDYGEERENKNFLRKTSRSFKRHRISDDLFDDLGNKDITSDVDFSTLIKGGEEIRLKKIFLWTQEKFLLENRILDFKINNDISKINQLKVLLNPEFMGEKFKVLFLKKIT
ncbi:MAG: SAM-dependent methyltransferase [Acidobacteriota bacterium]